MWRRCEPLFRATGDKSFLTAARTHFGEAFRLRGSGRKLAGYGFWTNLGDSPEPAWGPDASLLSGITGVGLALLTATYPVVPGSDGLLMSEDGVTGPVTVIPLQGCQSFPE